MIWLLFILMAMLAAGAVLRLTWRIDDRVLSALLTGIIPVLALLLYLMLGRPDLPAQSAAAREDLAPRHLALLMQRPMDILSRDPDNLGALAAMGDLTERLRQYSKAEAFYARALKVARADNDPRADLYEKDLAAVKAKISGAHLGQP